MPVNAKHFKEGRKSIGSVYVFCYQCLKNWTKYGTNCPVCTVKFSKITHNMGKEVEYIESPSGSNLARIKLYLVILSLCIICIIGIFNAIYIIARASYVISSIFGFKVALIHVSVHVDEFVLIFFGKRHQNAAFVEP